MRAGPASTVAEAMTAQVPRSRRHSAFRRARTAQVLAASRDARLDGDKLVGLLTTDNITDLLLVRRAIR